MIPSRRSGAEVGRGGVRVSRMRRSRRWTSSPYLLGFQPVDPCSPGALSELRHRLTRPTLRDSREDVNESGYRGSVNC